MLLLARSFEISDAQASGIENEGAALINAVKKPMNYPRKNQTQHPHKRGTRNGRGRSIQGEHFEIEETQNDGNMRKHAVVAVEHSHILNSVLL